MVASLDDLTRLEQTLLAKSLDHACLLIVRSRLNAQLIHNEEATAYNRATKKLAQLSNALYMKSQILKEIRDYGSALATLSQSRAISVQLKEVIEVAFADGERCIVLLAMDRPDEAEQACLDADRVWSTVGRADMQAATEGNLARVDLIRGKPAAALDRLDRILRFKIERVAPNHLPELYRYRGIGGTARVEGLAAGGTRCIVSIPLETLAAGLDAPAPAMVLSPS